ncbi:DUF3857 and transglutaminase domain-containing protein [Flammeovirga yaeyamensis]|uniref:DUF3857 and transglutaminase domain-containing protein n=1 Tax=Flammeovirga yaeyamensis TaxID=367791 RepID=A0AAX1MZY4_9BACT|nr:DUF3857 domain-containing protein [Flammeovirga yaeyamensis]MBB3700273.1 transglutaminase-like putative cysteine protease [Flammeovirga yaeyamensis]NMF37101.1 DUF3857 domain-containing protein [Flammeovirga yaeyamensis]QWG00792.1 DUF3857 and transglutaminase domain-containing protein [Flammeovirga yaeyamensis]
MLYYFKQILITLFLLSHAVVFAQNAQVVSYDTHIAIENGKLKKTVDVSIQINDKDAVYFGEVEIPYNSSMRVNRAYILDKNGVQVKKLKGKDIGTKSLTDNSTFYSDAHVKYFNLKWSNFPYTIYYSYTVSEDNYVNLATWSPAYFSNIDIQSASLEVELPLHYQYKVYEKGNYIKSENNKEGKKTMSWEFDLSQDLVIKSERFSPHLFDKLPLVIITPKNVDFGGEGDMSTWKSYGDWVYSLSDGLDELTPLEKRRVHALTDHIPNKREKAKVLYRYMQENTRYINVTIDIGGLKPYPADYVCENKYGDCKALTNYMKALLKEVDIPSYAIDVNAGSEVKKIISDFPSQQFNHVILGVPFEKDTVYLENTSKYLPFNYLSDFTYGRQALWVEKGNSRLITLPSYTTDNAKEEVDLNFKLKDNLTADLSVDWTVRGTHFATLLEVKNTFNENEQKEYFKNLALVYDIEVDSMSINTIPDSDALEVKLEGTVQKIIRQVGTLKVISPINFFNTKLEDIKDRVHDVVVHHPIHQQFTVTYDLSVFDKDFVEFSPEKIIATKYGSFAITYEHIKQENKVKMHQTLLIPSGHYPIKEYAGFHDFIKNVENIMKNSNVILKRTI